MRVVTLRDGRQVGDDQRCVIVAEGGINHDGRVDVALDLCRAAKGAGADYIKWQKKSPRLCVPTHQWNIPKEAPWAETLPYITYKERMELGSEQFDAIAAECKRLDLPWFASVWDRPSLKFMLAYDPPAIKVPSACLTDLDLLEAIRRSGRPAILSTGMSTTDQISRAVATLGPDRLIILHCKSAYPTPPNELNLLAIVTLRGMFPQSPIGFSDHHEGLWMSLCAAALGASMIEKHFTLSRASKGTDHAVSVEPKGMAMLIQQIRRWEEAKGDGILGMAGSERAVLHKLRRVP